MTGPLVVVGDTLLDRDVAGAVSRVCPDAPVPVLDERAATDRPGGAGLAALLAAAQDIEVALVTALADDAGGTRLAELLAEAGVEVYPPHLPGATAEKIRLRAGGQVLLRLDRGGDPQPPGEPSEAALDVLARAPPSWSATTGAGWSGSRRCARRWPRRPPRWSGTRTRAARPPWPGPAWPPRTSRTAAARRRRGAGPALSTATRGAHELRRRWRVGAVAVTLGADGAVLCHAGSTPLVVPPPSALHREDTCGAGDRFAATAALALGDGALVSEAVGGRRRRVRVRRGGRGRRPAPAEAAARPGRGADRRRGAWWRRYAPPAAPWWPPAAASTSCTPGTSPPFRRPAGSATAWWSASTPTAASAG